MVSFLSSCASYFKLVLQHTQGALQLPGANFVVPQNLTVPVLCPTTSTLSPT